MNSAQQTFAFLDEPSRAVHGTVQSDVGFVTRDLYPSCANHRDRDAHWRLIEPNLHRGTPGTFLCDDCKNDMEQEANNRITQNGNA
jgi:hypothetical protein